MEMEGTPLGRLGTAQSVVPNLQPYLWPTVRGLFGARSTNCPPFREITGASGKPRLWLLFAVPIWAWFKGKPKGTAFFGVPLF